jgi:thiamine biosynthesis protein ThiI
MLRQVCLIHYHEIGLKGKNRAKFENTLKKNLEKVSQKFSIESISRISGRILILFKSAENSDEVISSFKLIPGVARVSVGYQCTRKMHEIKKACIKACEESEPFETFKIEARRTNTDFKTTSQELNILLGDYVLEQFPEKRAKMVSPDVRVRVEIIQGFAYIYAQSEPGVGGLPVGSAGKVVCLLSSGIDSPVAMWRLIHRGAIALPIHFSGYPETDDSSEHLVREIIDVLNVSDGIKEPFIVRFGSYQLQIAERVPSRLRVIMYRRLMFEIACEYARRVGALALVTGESLGQVASQTLENILAVDVLSSLPVFRPLIGQDKQEIIEEAKKLGTFELSIEQVSDCCTLFMPQKPETHANLQEVEEVYSALPIKEWIEEIFA